MTTFEPMLPDDIPIPLATAAGFSIALGDPTARDLATAFAVIHLATVHGTDDGRIEIADNPLRAETGRFTRQSAEREHDRLERLAATTVLLPGGAEAKLPTQWMLDAGRSRTDAGGVVWEVDPALVDAFAERRGEPVVMFPGFLLRNARSRHSLMLGLRVLAWWNEAIEPRFEQRRRDDFLVLRFPVEELRLAMMIPHGTQPSGTIAILKAAAEEVGRYSDHHVEIEPVRTRYRDGKVGKIAAIEVRISPLIPDCTVDAFLERVAELKAVRRQEWERKAIEEAERQIAEGKRKRKWQRAARTRPAPPDAAPAEVSNVVALPIDKMRPAFVQDPLDGRIGAERPPMHTRDQGDETDVH